MIRVLGYPIQIYDQSTHQMGKNENYLYTDEGPVKDINFHNNHSCATVLYDYHTILTSKGQSGAEI